VKRTLGALCAVALLAAGAAGCGGSGRLSKQDFVAKANGICSRYTARIKAAVGKVGNTPEAIGTAMNKAIPLLETADGDLNRLKPPKSLDSEYAQWKATNSRQVEDFKKIRAAAKARNVTVFRTVSNDLAAITEESNRLANQLGLKACAS
jgi:hypothetical protein